jgi:hypothetical protein
MSNGSKLLVLGLRGSGKTSYMAALWHLVEAGEIPASLSVAELQPDREYLNRIRDSWLRLEEVGRTPITSQETVSLLLREAANDSLIDVALPDHSGESFHVQWALRRAARSYVEFAEQASGILLFIHPRELKRPTPAHSLADTDAQVGSTITEYGSPWSAESSPTQVKLVEILQFAQHIRLSPNGGRIAIIVSAWDRISDPILPAAWLDNRAPLLHQYLLANDERTRFRVYGVSAIGGDLQHDAESLRKQVTPSRRIRVIERKLKHHHDLTAPLRFLLGLED